jgi:PAS domain S-box-containing protein
MIRILLVDDQPDFLEITRLFLEREGKISVDTAVSAEAALTILTQKKYDAVVSDYEMVGMDGIAFLDEFKRRGVDKPFIIFTGKSREDVVIRALNSGADFYLQKCGEPNIQYAELRNMIQQAVMRKRVEEALIRSEINHRTIVESTEDSIYMVDRTTRYLFMNTHHQRRLGITDGNYGKRIYSEFHSPEESQKFAVAVEQVFDTGAALQDEYSQGSRWFIRRLSPVRNETLERIVAVTVVSTEVTSRKRAEESVRISEENYRIVVESTQDSIYTVDPDCRYLFMNTHHKQRLGIADDDYRTKRYGDYHTPEETERFSGLIERVIRTQSSLEDRYSQERRDFIRKIHPIFDALRKEVTAIAVISIENTRQNSCS